MGTALLCDVDLEAMTKTMIVHLCVDPVEDGETIKALIVSTIIVEGHPVEVALVVLQCIENQGVAESIWMPEIEIIIVAENLMIVVVDVVDTIAEVEGTEVMTANMMNTGAVEIMELELHMSVDTGLMNVVTVELDAEKLKEEKMKQDKLFSFFSKRTLRIN